MQSRLGANSGKNGSINGSTSGSFGEDRGIEDEEDTSSHTSSARGARSLARRGKELAKPKKQDARDIDKSISRPLSKYVLLILPGVDTRSTLSPCVLLFPGMIFF